MRLKYNDGEWTAARFNSFIKGALRTASLRWPPRFRVLKSASVGKKINIKSGRQAEHYKCAACLGEFPQKDVQVDHIIPVIDPSTGFTTWDDVINNMFCEKHRLQVMCIPCHKKKTIEEKQFHAVKRYDKGIK